jgi:hypothetical protein
MYHGSFVNAGVIFGTNHSAIAIMLWERRKDYSQRNKSRWEGFLLKRSPE